MTILTKYLLNIFAILILLSIILLFSINLIVGLALTLFEDRVFMFCQNFLLSKTEFISRFAKCCFFFCFFQEVNRKISLFFCILFGTFLSYLSLENLFRTETHCLWKLKINIRTKLTNIWKIDETSSTTLGETNPACATNCF